MKLLIVRHGETYDNVNGVVTGHRPGKLTPKGKRQAKAAALRLKSEHIDAIFSSDLRRAKDTAKEIAKFHDLPIRYTRELRERHMGALQGKSHDVYFEAHRKSGLGVMEFVPKNGEGWQDLYKRILKFTKSIYPKYKDKTILFVCHAGVSQVLISIYLHTPINVAMHTWPKNGGVLALSITKSRAKVLKNTLV
ncbi:MAG: histidine phosphatase family protein [Candidatus Micrarchaeota archaeon]|nr:histidine phosphatase family protein [Candidatus Micrarchaeota archaeon]